jgi:hypothetical protein
VTSAAGLAAPELVEDHDRLLGCLPVRLQAHGEQLIAVGENRVRAVYR